MTDSTIPHNHVAIIGTGFGGIATAIRLQQTGFHDFVLLERAKDIGGVWRDNNYPGAAVDVQCQLYSFSFAPNPHWRNFYAKQAEIHGYLKDVTERFGLRRHLMLDCAVQRLDWNPTSRSGALKPRAASAPPTTSSSPPVHWQNPSYRSCPAWTDSLARRSTPPGGITTSTSPASGWPSSARAPQQCSSFRPSSPLRGTSPSSSALRTGSCRATTVKSALGPSACFARFRRCSGRND